ncbi:MAG: DNA polymerase III subunit gamma/tau [Candidatus Omnitrophota bacterium]
MTHQAYARKYRPKNFDEVVDQQHIATTLKNAILKNNIAHAYLFSGPRGIGKTSTARILAKALNCADGPTPTPCNKCIACLEIREGRSMDVLEIDGASNRGIDEIRTLRENVKFAPTSSRFKIYIIDEIHMLTTEAFNALLKTLEEPPKHVKFIFATTEPHKVLATILSRCQRFDFRKITTASIVQTLKKLSAEEKIKVDEEALFAIAKSADGGLRDAEVILDQLNSFSKGKITLNDVNSVLGLVSGGVIASIVENLNIEHRAENLELLDELIHEGKDPAQIVTAFIEYFRYLMLEKCNCEKLIALPKEDKERIKKQSVNMGIDNILYCLAVLSQTNERIKRQGVGRLLLEMAMIKLSEQQMLISGIELMDQLKDIEVKLKDFSPEPGPVLKPARVVPVSAPVKSAGTPKPVQELLKKTPLKYPETQSETLNETTQAVMEKAPAGDLTQEKVVKFWPYVIKALKQKKMSLGLYLAEGRIMEVQGNKIHLGFLPEYDLHRESLEETQNLKLAESVASELLDQPIRITLLCCEAVADNPVAVGVSEDISNNDISDPTPIPEEHEGEEISDFIQSAMDVFNGRIVHDE